MDPGSAGPPWLTITIAGLSLLGVVITAVVGPVVVDRRSSRPALPKSPDAAVIAQRADDAVMIIQHEISDLQNAAQLQASADDIRRLAQGAHDLGVQANDELARRGLATVPIPTPGTAPDSQVLAAASTAQVAAKIAAESIVVPTPAQIRAEVAAQLAKLPPPPVGPAPQQLTDAVQAYVAATSEQLRGPRGERGEAGKSPPCLAEPTQCQGAQGEPGPRGEPPVGWTVEEADGSTTSCQRAADFTVTAPKYRCSHAASTPSTAPSSPAMTTEPAEPGGAVPLPLPVG